MWNSVWNLKTTKQKKVYGKFAIKQLYSSFLMLLQILRDIGSPMQRHICCSSPLQNQSTQSVLPLTAALHPQPPTGFIWGKRASLSGEGRGDREWEEDQEDGKSYCTWVQSRFVDGMARKHLKHGKDCHMLAKCALIWTHAAPLSDLSTHSGFAANKFQLPALNTPTVFWLSPGNWLCCKSKLHWKINIYHPWMSEELKQKVFFLFSFMLDGEALDGLMVSPSLSALANLTLSSFLLSGIQCIWSQ